ncbi:uncharacterized protein LOC128899348 [Dryobates pubescens]|uniref:uncharacterized protein LOC128899348 n=1 Tax=Dryobates pubescens TaxID=118200 RepID=UPI0023B9B95E|nr:uncharacterized protein LOC128899348 [Dryobates pubescens]
MALKFLALRFLLALVFLVAAQGQEEPDLKVQGVPWETEMCQRPRWDSRLQLAPEKDNYKKNEEVMLSCIDGLQPPFTKIKCSRQAQSISHGKPIYREVWLRKDSRGLWTRIHSRVECLEVFQVVPGTWEISSTSIKVNWTCGLPGACQNMQAMCRLAEPSSAPCEADEVEGEQILQGQEGTFSCPLLQPFTDYTITITLPPSTILFAWLIRTEGTVPDKPGEPWLDPNTSSLRWKALPSCRGEILGIQLNITSWSTQDGGLLEMERLRLSGSATEHSVPQHGAGSSYVVTMRGVTAAGAGAASRWTFHTNTSDSPQPPSVSCRRVRDISPSQGTAVLPLRPIARPEATTSCSIQHLWVGGLCLQGEQWGRSGLSSASHLLQQAEKFTCICYSFSVVEVQPLGSWSGTVIGVVVLLALLMSAVILWFLLSRKISSKKS